ncbi:pyruvate dehydrogenase complex dihydrolipoamide acetyltransferase [Bartonella sp. DGB1]|uniref:pyruvate dehydrogenase complex dihydrolipoamide acetyltransferase n=1 Tax=Bartonella sp. DGB1 TaxID=3239807 RepID=UPI0035237C8A
MSIKILMPALSPTMEIGNLAKWLVKEGDKVNSGDIIAEIETDKATMELESIDEGIVAKILIAEGAQAVKVNSLLAVLAEDGEEIEQVIAELDAPTAAVNTATKAEAPANNATTGTEAKPLTDTIEKTNKEVTVTVNNNDKLVNNHSGKIFASPLARRLAKEYGLELSAIQATGPKGRIIKVDVENARNQATMSNNIPLATASEKDILSLFDPENYNIIPHDNMRKTIAKRLLESKLTVPHFYLTIDCELDKLLSLRQEINADAPIIATEKGNVPAYKISVNDMVLRAVALSLRDLPAANVSWLDSGMIHHKHVDIGVAVSIEGGLITPIIRKAEEKNLIVISKEMQDLAKRARDRKLKPQEYQGGTTSVSNLGMFGVKQFSAIVNPPQSTIFAIGAGEKRPIIKNDSIAIANIMSVTISSDHRSVDGALAAELAKIFKGYIEKPLSLLL